MTATRSRKGAVSYRREIIFAQNKQTTCVFCDELKQNSEHIIQVTKHFFVLRNKFPYTLWDSQRVSDHLMLIPKKHTDKLGGLGGGAGEEFLNLIDKYEDKGYNIYARAPNSPIKAIMHHHTHLIKPTGAMQRFLLHIKRPYIRWHF
jgi:diadenosine tetraphosphate (Ap4A) HIT family hydrolase